MHALIEEIEKKYKKPRIADIRSGDTVRVHQKIKEGGKERVQVFEGLVINTKRKNSLSSSITVRRIASGVGVEKTYLVHSPNIVKIDVVKRSKVRRNYLSYMRQRSGKSARMTSVDFDKDAVNVPEDKTEEAKEAAEALSEESIKEAKEATEAEKQSAETSSDEKVLKGKEDKAEDHKEDKTEEKVESEAEDSQKAEKAGEKPAESPDSEKPETRKQESDKTKSKDEEQPKAQTKKEKAEEFRKKQEEKKK